MRRAWLLGLVLATGCSMVYHNDRLLSDMSSEVQQVERRTKESRTLSALAALERSLNDFLQSERKIPAKIDDLVPKYLGEIPEVELGTPGFKPSNIVTVYPGSIIIDGQINGSALQDTGGWGYVFNDRQVIVFVDSTQKRLDGTLWYKARGVY